MSCHHVAQVAGDQKHSFKMNSLRAAIVANSSGFPLGSAEDEWMVSYFSFLWRLKHPQEAGGVDWKERSVNNKLPGRELITIGVMNADLEKPRKSLLLPKMKKIYNKNVSRRYQDIKLLLYTPVYLIR